MKYGDLTLGQIEALVNKLGGMDEVRKILAGQTPQVAAPSIFLPQIRTLIVSNAVNPFVAKNHFVEGTPKKGRPKFYLDSQFEEEFLGITVAPRDGYVLSARTLKKSANDTTILKELGDPDGNKVSTDLYGLYIAISLQANGEEGFLKTDGYANIFYMRNQDGVLRAVFVRWGGDGWSVFVCSVSLPGGWFDGRQVVSRNS